MRTTVEFAIYLHAVSDDRTTAVLAPWRQLVNRALEAVEHVPRTGCDHLETHLVVVTAYFAFRHIVSISLGMPAPAGRRTVSAGFNGDFIAVRRPRRLRFVIYGTKWGN
jgi:hypothetical protein